MVSLKRIIANNIYILRNEHGLTQQEFADKLSIGMSRSHISRIESGEYSPSADFIYAVSVAFQITTDVLLSNHVTANNDDALDAELDNSELELIFKLRTLSDESKNVISSLVDVMCNMKNKDK